MTTRHGKPSTLSKILELLSPRERRTGAVVLALMILLALVETAGVASVMPFLAVLGNPELVETQPALAWAYERGGFASPNRFLLALGVGAFAVVAFGAVLRIVTTYWMNHWVQMRRYSIGVALLSTYLRQPYEFFLGRNSADLSKSILSEVDDLIDKVFQPGMYLLAYGLVGLVLIGFLVWIDPALAGIIAFVVGGAYALIYFAVRGILGRAGKGRVVANRDRFMATSEALGGIKDLKVLGREEAYLKRFRVPARRFSRYQALAKTLPQAPKYLVEAVGVGGVILLAVFLLGTGGDLGTILPVLGAYTFAGYRLLPAAQQIYAGFSTLRYGLPAVDDAWQELRGPSRPPSPASREFSSDLDIGGGIHFDRVTFHYSGAGDPALDGMSLHIPSGTSLAFVGTTGAGKTTAVDLLLGLLSPTHGCIRLGDTPLSPGNIRDWQDNLGYVPQTIYLADASVAENIAFGIPEDEMDLHAVERAAKLAAIHDFIETGLPNGYRTTVGERGVRLSGGQRQRLGIARALYHNPDVLVLDEATSALDTATEREIMRAIDRLTGEKTIIMIAHRMSTVVQCDQIAVLDRGRLVGVGSYEQLLDSSPIFRRLAVA